MVHSSVLVLSCNTGSLYTHGTLIPDGSLRLHGALFALVINSTIPSGMLGGGMM